MAAICHIQFEPENPEAMPISPGQEIAQMIGFSFQFPLPNPNGVN